MEYLKSVFNKKQIIFLISAFVSALLGLLLVVICVNLTKALLDQQFVDRWSKDNSTAQVSAFFSELSDFNEDGVRELAYKVNNKLTQDSITAANENARMFVYAFSANGKAFAESKTGSADARVLGVGGDFFMFHPFTLLNGSFFDSDYEMKDLVMIDDETAWLLFGSTDVCGQYVDIDGNQFVVSGVFRKADGRLNELSGNDSRLIIMSYGALKEIRSSAYINCYEAIMPNPLTDYARQTLEGLISADQQRFEVIENSERFHFTKLLKNVAKFGTRGINGKGIVYPFWENVARGYEDYLTPVAVLGCLLFAYPSVIVFILLIRMIKKRTIHKEDVKDFIERRIEKIREKRLERKRKKGDIYEEY